MKKTKLVKKKLYDHINKKIFKNKKIIKLHKIKIKQTRQHKKMGGSSDVDLIYNLIILLKPKKIIEFGVASGWSTLSILKACKFNKFGFLTSIDMPYDFNNARMLIGNLVGKNLEKNGS